MAPLLVRTAALLVSLVEFAATLYLWLPVPPRYASSMQFTTDVLEKTGIVVAPGSGFGKAGEGYVRIALCVSEERLREATRRMAEAGLRY